MTVLNHSNSSNSPALSTPLPNNSNKNFLVVDGNLTEVGWKFMKLTGLYSKLNKAIKLNKRFN